MRLSRSNIEEIIGSLALIAALLAWTEFRWLAWILFAKAGIDWWASMYYARKQIAEERTPQ